MPITDGAWITYHGDVCCRAPQPLPNVTNNDQNEREVAVLMK